MTLTPAATVRSRMHQLAWAARQGITVDGQGYTLRLDDNLFQPLNDCTRAELGAGAGGELGVAGGRGKIQALHASSALAINVFDYWRSRSREPLERALGLPSAITDIQFERTFPTGMQGTPPHLDVTLCTEDGGLIAIESKFLEAYPAKTKPRPFRDTYFPVDSGRWAARSLQGCQSLAEALRSGARLYHHLDVQQLLKHALGLAHTVGDGFALWYFWYDPGGEEGGRHRRELEEFSACIDPALGFRAMSYQVLFARLEAVCGGEHAEYLAYLSARYGELPG